jgi:hypothetical protein
MGKSILLALFLYGLLFVAIVAVAAYVTLTL